MNIWEILEIDPTAEISAIKKAYAKKLRINHPEDDPQGFQLLHEAYNSALKFAKKNGVYKAANIQLEEEVLLKEIIKHPLKVEKIQKPFIEESYEDIPENNNNYSPPNVNIINDFVDIEANCDSEAEYNNYSPPNVSIVNDLVDMEANRDNKAEYNNYSPPNANIINDFVDVEVNYEKRIFEFFERVNFIYNNFTYRTQEKNWKELLNDDIMWRLELMPLINTKMIEFLMGHHFLIRDIWKILNETFHWDEQEKFLNDSYPETFTKYLLKQIGEERVLRYYSFNISIEIDYEQYFHYREEAQRALLGTDLKLVKDYIALAYEMYQSDPDLLCIKGEYYLRIGEKNKALEVLKNAIWINPSDANMYLYQAQIMYDSKNFSEAIKICKSFKTTQYMDLEMRTLLGKCYFSTPKLHKSSQIFLENVKINSTHIESIKYLNLLGITIFLVLTKDSLNVVLRRDLKKICLALGKPSQVGKFKITFKGILYLFKKFFTMVGKVVVLWGVL